LLHPNSFVLGTTLEFIALPTDLMAMVEGKSSLGRVGLIIATAGQVGPGFHGVIVLELSNVGTVPLELTPGIPIGQIIFHTLVDAVSKDLRRSRFDCQIEP
jgi:dCTP deaminase